MYAFLAMILGPGLAGCTKSDSAALATTSAPPTAAARRGEYHLDHAQPKLPAIQLWVGAAEVEAELARSLTEISTGMMFRTNLAENAGMLFVFARPEQRGFYMKNCTVPLSAAYIDRHGVIDQIVDLQPGVLESVMSRSQAIQFVLEVPQGWFARRHVTTGMVINTSLGPLTNIPGARVW